MNTPDPPHHPRQQDSVPSFEDRRPTQYEELFRIIASLERDPLSQSYEDVFDWCYRYAAARHRGGLTAENLREVSNQAVVDTAERLFDPSISPEKRGRALVQSIERRRKEAKRSMARWEVMEGYDETANDWRPEDGHGEAVLLREHLHAVGAKVFGCLAKALPTLRPNEHDLLIEHYGLVEEGFEYRLSEPQSFSSETARKKALYRSRRRFREVALSLLNFELEAAAPGHRSLIGDAIKVLEADEVASVIQMLGE